MLGELEGLRALARSLVYGDADADDLLQDTAIAALQHPPVETGPRAVRSWLAAVLRNRWRMDRRSEARRRAREHAALLADADREPGPDPVARARALERLADAYGPDAVAEIAPVVPA